MTGTRVSENSRSEQGNEGGKGIPSEQQHKGVKLEVCAQKDEQPRKPRASDVRDGAGKVGRAQKCLSLCSGPSLFFHTVKSNSASRLNSKAVLSF